MEQTEKKRLQRSGENPGAWKAERKLTRGYLGMTDKRDLHWNISPNVCAISALDCIAIRHLFHVSHIHLVQPFLGDFQFLDTFSMSTLYNV